MVDPVKKQNKNKRTKTDGFFVLLAHSGDVVGEKKRKKRKKEEAKTDGFFILLDGRCARGTGWWCG